MNKTILLVGFIPICALIGKILSQKFTDKRIFFEDFLLFITLIENEVNFTQKNLFEIIENLPTRKFLAFIQRRLNNEVIKTIKLTEQEVSVFNKFFMTLGKLDKYSQKEALKEAKTAVQSFYESAKIIENKNTTLYFKLGILIGIFIFIIFL